MSKLVNLAKKMKATALATGRDQVSLKNGLTLTLRYIRSTDTWVLSLTRKGVRPSDKEEEVIRRDFNVPASASREQTVKQPYQIIRLVWRDPVIEQVEMFPGVKPISVFE